MAGYDYARGMSNNAVAAYEAGKKPLSKLTARDFKRKGLNISKDFAVWLAKQGHWPRSEWHHSGGTWYNEIDFYDVDDLIAFLEDEDTDVQALERQYKKSKQLEKEQLRVHGSYIEWGGTRKNPVKLGERQFTGVKIDNWIYLDGGGRKKADGNSITWSYTGD